MKKGLKFVFIIWFASLVSFLTSCTGSDEADLILTNGRVYTYTWDDPAPDGTPASSAPYGFDQKLVAGMIHGGYQVGIHAIGDSGNRETLDFFERVLADDPGAAGMRHRIEHSQVIHPNDFQRFAKLGIIASMQPPHAVEDKAWAEDRLGPERIKGAYAWRTLRKAGVRLIFNSDLTGSDPNFFYGLHSAITRRGKDLQPPGGWFPEQALTTEEAVRAYTVWPAYAAFLEDETGTLAPGKWADISVLAHKIIYKKRCQNGDSPIY